MIPSAANMPVMS